MKIKIVCMLVVLVITLALAACGGDANISTINEAVTAPNPTPETEPTPTPTPTAEPTPTPEPTPKPTPEPTLEDVWIELLNEHPVISWEDFRSGDYSGQYVIIEGVVGHVSELIRTSYSFHIYIPSEAGYVFISVSTARNDDIAFSQFSYVKSGDIVEICFFVGNNNMFSIGSTNRPVSLRIVGETLICDVIESFVRDFKASCANLIHANIMRNPENYDGQRVRVVGSVFQIIEQTNTHVVLLLETRGGDIVHVRYNQSSALHRQERGGRIIEGDTLSIYGISRGLHSYRTILGSTRTVPHVVAWFIVIL